MSRNIPVVRTPLNTSCTVELKGDRVVLECTFNDHYEAMEFHDHIVNRLRADGDVVRVPITLQNGEKRK
jgi:hypothetical protein